MENGTEQRFKLDRDFDRCLADMKPYVLKLPQKSERQKCAVWIQKLCEPVGSAAIDRRTRNQYTQLMLKMLKKGSLHSPFDQKPDEGPLKLLPTYMVEGLPNWVEDQLSDTAGSSVIAGYLSNPAATSTWVSSLGELTERPHSSLDKVMGKDPALSSIRSYDPKGYSVDDMSVEVKWAPSLHPRQNTNQNSTSDDRERRHLPEVKSKEYRDEVRLKESTSNDLEWSKPLTSILTNSYSLPKGLNFCDDSSYHKPADREAEVRIQMVEAKFQKEKLKLQQKHDVDVQKILDRKNNEIEDMKGHYKAKSKEMEETIGKLERKVQTLMKETEFIKQTKDKQIVELRKITEESNEARRNEFDKRLHNAMAEFEQVKFELQKQHTQNIQEILDDTNNRLQHMEAEYSQQTTASTNLIKKLESRVQQLMNDVDCTLSQRSEVEKEKNEALAKCEKMAVAYERLKEKLCQLEREQQMTQENHQLEILGLKSKAEASIEHLVHEHTFAASKAANTISELEETIDHLTTSLKDAESNWRQQIKILDRKNNEIEDMKGHYKAKSKEMEETIGKLERKVQTLMKETEFIKQTKDKQIVELRKITEESNEARRNEFDKRLHNAMAEFEQVKFELQKQHTQNIQEILDDTNNRLQHMEAEYSQQTTASTNLIKKLESRVQQLMNDVDCTLSQRSEVEKEKNEALAKCEKMAVAYERLKEKLCQLEREQQMTQENHQLEILGLKSKAEASIEHLVHEHTFAASKAANTISELEETIDHLTTSLKDAESNWRQQIKELEETHQRSRTHLENIHEKQISKLKKEMEEMNENWASKVTKLEQQVREKEGAVSKLKEQNQQHSLQAKKTLEEFKDQVEKNQKRIHEEMKQQMQQVVTDLNKSKQAREKQSKEFSRHLDEERYRHQSEISETRTAFEAEKSKMVRDFHMQKEYILKEHEQHFEHLKELQEAEIQQLETRVKEKQDKFDKSLAENEQLIRELREELVQVNQLRKQQLVELGTLREEEKQKIQRDHEAELARLRAAHEQQKSQLSKAHSAEMEAVLEKTNDQLRNIDREYAGQRNKSKESISELQSVIVQMKLDIKRLHDSSEEKLIELQQNFEQEKQSLHKQYSQTMSKAQKELESQRSQTRNAERRLQKLESEQEGMVTQLKLQFEEKVRGLLPVNLKQDLEDTIASLKSQVFSLQKKSELLQEELDNNARTR